MAYLGDDAGHRLQTGSRDFVIRSTQGIAARDFSDRANVDAELVEGEKYIAAIAFDGDSIGRWVSGELLNPNENLETHHKDFSKALSNFALKRARGIVEKNHQGFLIYAGGDDVVALVPADVALDCAAELREAFLDAAKGIKDRLGRSPDASAGIAIAHVKSPLQDLIRAAQIAEKDAKTKVGRPAFSVTLMKRSGEISHWGAKWDSGGLALYREIAKRLVSDEISAKFPHRVCQLLEPYLTRETSISRQIDAIDAVTARELIASEFAFAATRQGSPAIAGNLAAPLDRYIIHLEDEPQAILESVIGLCTTLAFADRNRNKSLTAEKQPAAL